MIVLEILFDMMERYIDDKKEKDIDEIYLDISSGHNIYISAMIEASRHFAVLTKLMHWIHEERQPRIYLTFSDPITGRTAESYELHIQPQSYTAFFSSPINKKEACDHNFSFYIKFTKNRRMIRMVTTKFCKKSRYARREKL
ncbi:TM1812 family CRISPR-associated protein [Anaerocellum danielii]|uniref:TM1812 family CRISPR-associated protein n=1 Tax=Anaerocellum danielii TaxID=1387557 RepID=A0ABZ0TZV1_9FIRM|nr:TM1812 family CRISPR-associated protein [Caldicellulosiruptor danielii]WPX08764.1 TM1812 family CRISPR-associated protein [Caldicellulosiruptor danielii]